MSHHRRSDVSTGTAPQETRHRQRNTIIHPVHAASATACPLHTSYTMFDLQQRFAVRFALQHPLSSPVAQLAASPHHHRLQTTTAITKAPPYNSVAPWATLGTPYMSHSRRFATSACNMPLAIHATGRLRSVTKCDIYLLLAWQSLPCATPTCATHAPLRYKFPVVGGALRPRSQTLRQRTDELLTNIAWLNM